MKWVCLHCTIDLSRANWTIQSQNLILKGGFLSQSLMVITVQQLFGPERIFLNQKYLNIFLNLGSKRNPPWDRQYTYRGWPRQHHRGGRRGRKRDHGLRRVCRHDDGINPPFSFLSLSSTLSPRSQIKKQLTVVSFYHQPRGLSFRYLF